MTTRFTENGQLIIFATIITGIFGIDTRQTMSYQLFSLLFFVSLFAYLVTVIRHGKYSIKRVLPEFASVDTGVQYKIIIDNNNSKAVNDIEVRDNLESSAADFKQYRGTLDRDDEKRNIVDRFIGYPRFVTYLRRLRGAATQPVKINTIAAGESTAAYGTVYPTRRGYIYFNKTLISETDIFGLARSVNIVQQPDKLLVLPRCYDFPELPLPGTRNYQKGDIQQSSSVGDTREFFALRDYRPGDSTRSIHWPSYAKCGYPIVKEFHDEYFTRIGVVLDTCIEGLPEINFEDAVSVAASAALANRKPDGLLDLIYIDNEPNRHTSGRGMHSIHHLLELLACLEPSHDTNFELLENTLIEYSCETSCYLIIFLDWDENRKQMVRHLLQRNIPVFVIVISASPIEQTPTDPLSGKPGLFWNILAGKLESQLTGKTLK